MKLILAILYLFLSTVVGLSADKGLSWEGQPEGGVNFTVPGIDAVPDLHGDPTDPDLVIFFGGNQFMVLPELIRAFQEKFPQYKKIFYETLPPGIIEQQLKTGSLVTGGLKISLRPDLFVAGLERVKRLSQEGWIAKFKPYISNEIVIMVPGNNPKEIAGLTGLARPQIRIAMPNPATEGINEKIVNALVKAGGKDLVAIIMEKKLDSGETIFTEIHHRQTPLWLMEGRVDAGPVWRTEALYQQQLGNAIDFIELPEEHKVSGKTAVGIVKDATNEQAAKDFYGFLSSETAGEIYKRYGFLPPE
jgi:ABC-type molybdate transport system substrate-binding protein